MGTNFPRTREYLADQFDQLGQLEEELRGSPFLEGEWSGLVDALRILDSGSRWELYDAMIDAFRARDTSVPIALRHYHDARARTLERAFRLASEEEAEAEV